MPDQPSRADAPTTGAFVPSSPTHVRNIAFTLLSVAIVILLLQFMQSVLIPFVVAGLLFYALNAPVDWLQKKRIPRAIAAGAMLLFVVAGTITLAYSLQGQALTVIDQLPAGARKLAALISKAPGADPGAVEKVQQAADALQQSETPSKAPAGVTRVQIEEQGFRAGTFAWSGSVGLMSGANQAIMVLFLTFFMLLSDELFKRKLVEIVGTLSQKSHGECARKHCHAALEGTLLTPTLMSRASSMNQVAIFAGLLFWSWAWGIWGMLLAVPMMMAIKVICEHVEPLHPVAHLLSE